MNYGRCLNVVGLNLQKKFRTLYHQTMAEASPELKAEATELFTKFATMEPNYVTPAFINAGLKIRFCEIDSLINESIPDGFPGSDLPDVNYGAIPFSEFVDLLRRKKLRDEEVERDAKQYLDKYDKNSKLTEDEVKETIYGVFGKYYSNKDMAEMVNRIYLMNHGCVTYEDLKNYLY